MTYRAELSGQALKQMHGLPGLAFDSLIETMAEVVGGGDDFGCNVRNGSDGPTRVSTQLAAEGKPNITRSCDASISWVRRITRTVRCRLTNPGVMLKA